jgi:TPR repeat protein
MNKYILVIGSVFLFCNLFIQAEDAPQSSIVDLAQAAESGNKAAVQSLYQKAVYGNAAAQNIIGYYIDTGTCGFDRNPQMAAEWYRRSAEQGIATAQWNLALCYEYGKGVDKDLVKARLWYSQAELRGYIKARERLEQLGMQSTSGKSEITPSQLITKTIQDTAASTKQAASDFWDKNGVEIKQSAEKIGQNMSDFYKRNQTQIETTTISILGAYLGHELTKDTPSHEPLPATAQDK